MIKNVIIFQNGNVAVLDDKDEQVSELQRNIGNVFAAYARSQGYTVGDTISVLFGTNKTPIAFDVQ